MSEERRICVECNKHFIITESEADTLRRLAAERGWTVVMPKRCRDCRAARRAGRAVRAEGDERSRRRYDEEQAAWREREQERGTAAGRTS